MRIGDGVIPGILDQNIYNEIVIITDEEALQTARDLAPYPFDGNSTISLEHLKQPSV